MKSSPWQTAPPRPIVFCITELDPGGAERALVQLVTRLDRQQWEPTVICLADHGELAEPLEQAGIPVIALGARKWWQLSVLWRLISHLRRIRPVVLQTFLFHANFLGRLAAWVARVPVVVGGIRVAERRSAWYLRLDRLTQKLVTRQVCVSQGVREFCEKEAGLTPESLIVIGNGVDAERFAEAIPAERADFGCEPTDLLLLAVGRLDPQKGMLDLLAAVSQLRNEFPHLKLLIAGEGPLRGVMERGIEVGQLQTTVQLLGRRSDVPALYRMADLFVLASHWEGQPNVVLEAMAAGLPIVSTRVEGIADLLTDHHSALLIPPGDIPALTTALRELLLSPALRQHLATHAQQAIQSDHTWTQMTTRYHTLYLDLLPPQYPTPLQ